MNKNQVLRGEALKTLKKDLKNNFGTDINVGTKVTAVGTFTFRAFKNQGEVSSGTFHTKKPLDTSPWLT